MYNEQMENLISAALADGVLTEKEKQILFKKAESMGIDLDEFEMVLDARLVEMKKREAQNVMPKPVKKDAVRKCPACGSMVDSFTTHCPCCGAELHNAGVAGSIEKFSERLAELEAQRNAEGSGKKNNIGCLTILMWILFYWILIPYHAIRMIVSAYGSPKLDEIDKRKQDFILNAPIPNSKEDLMEFIIFCVSRVESVSCMKMFGAKAATINSWNHIWSKKLDMLELKAKVAMKGSPESLAEAQRLIDGSKDKLKQNQRLSLYFLLVGIAAIALFVSIMFML